MCFDVALPVELLHVLWKCKTPQHFQPYPVHYRGANKSLAQPGKKQAAPVKSVMGRGMD